MESSPDLLTHESRFFLEPASSAQRQYEALRAYFVDGLSNADVSRRFGYTAGSFRVLCHHFRRSKPDFFRELKRGPHSQPKKDAVRELILGMRKQNLSIYDIAGALKTPQTPLSTTAIWEILHEEGFGRLPRRLDAELPATLHPTAAAVADRREFSLAPRRFSTQLGGLFLFLPFLAEGDLPGLVRQAGYPGSKMIPAAQAWLSLLGLKISSTERKSHVMDLVFDEGLALFAGLNVVPKTTYLETYSHSFSPKINEKLRKLWIGVLRQKKLLKGQSFNLDFHSIPFFGADEFVERHYLSKRSRSQKSILVFSGAGCRKPRVLLLPGRLAQAGPKRCGLGFRQVLEGGLWRTAVGVGLRLQTDYLCQAEPAEPDGHHLHDPAPPFSGDLARGGQHATVGLAHRSLGCATPHVSDSQSHRPAGELARL